MSGTLTVDLMISVPKIYNLQTHRTYFPGSLLPDPLTHSGRCQDQWWHPAGLLHCPVICFADFSAAEWKYPSEPQLHQQVGMSPDIYLRLLLQSPGRKYRQSPHFQPDQPEYPAWMQSAVHPHFHQKRRLK